MIKVFSNRIFICYELKTVTLQMLNCCIERKIKREQLFKGYTGQSADDMTDSGSPDDVMSSHLSTSDSEICGANESEESRHESKQHSKRDDEKEKEDIPAKRPHLDSSSDDEFFECGDEGEDSEDGCTEMEVETVMAKVGNV